MEYKRYGKGLVNDGKTKQGVWEKITDFFFVFRYWVTTQLLWADNSNDATALSFAFQAGKAESLILTYANDRKY